MPTDLVSLSVIALTAAVCPLAAKLVPGKLVPETVLLLAAGALLGPNMAGVIHLTDSVGLLSDLGLAFLFLLAGYEIDPKTLTDRQGKRALVTWLVTFGLALCAMEFLPAAQGGSQLERVALAIALTTTALGTLMPILKERGLLGTRVGSSILAYGTWGELGPILAMAVLLSSRAEWKTFLILAAFAALCVVVAVVPAKAKRAGHRAFRFLTENADTASQTMVRTVVLLMVGLVTLSAVFDLDIVLGAFAAGFVLRYIIPEGDDGLESKLDGMAFGFFIPVFFVSSGAKIDLAAVLDRPALLVGFIAALLLVRTVPIYLALSSGAETRDLSSHNRLTVALYCTTALPIIVAVTSVAVDANAMAQETAGVLVAAGAVTVFLMPLLASVTYRVADVKPIEAVKEIRERPRDARDILREHWELERMLARQEALERLAARRATWDSRHPSAVPWQDRAALLQRRSAYKRAVDNALDLAAREFAARHAEAGTHADERAALYAELLRQHHDERRRRLAAQVVREHRRRQAELGQLGHVERVERMEPAEPREQVEPTGWAERTERDGE